MRIRFVALCALCLPLVAQESSFKDVHVDKKPGEKTGPALVTIGGKVRRIATRALEAWPIMNGQNALVLWLDPKAPVNRYHLRFIEGATRKRRELGTVPFASATLLESEHDGNWAFVLAGTNGGDSVLIVADTDSIHGEIHNAIDPKIESGALNYKNPRGGESKSVSLDTILARDMRGIYKSHDEQFVQFNRDGTAVLSEHNGQFLTGVWRTDGLVLTIAPPKGYSLRFPRNALVPADGVPAGTRLAVRLLHALDSRKVAEGDAVRTVLISPAFIEGRILIPQGSELNGTIVKAHGVGWGIRHETAALTLNLRAAKLPDGRTLTINTRLYQVENSRETVDAKGAIRGIRSTETLGHSVESKLASVSAVDPIAYLFTTVSATAVLGFAEPEILYPAGTELVIEFTSPLITSQEYPPNVPPLTPIPGEDLNAFVRKVPFRTMTKGTNKPSDLTNLLFIGSLEGLRRAFHAAGWVPTDQLTAGSTFQTLKTLSGNQTYREAPMSTLLLDERPPLFTLTKTTNTFSSRHHLRVFDPALRYGGETVLTSSSTQDIGIAFSRKQKTFIHVIDQYIDNERSKVVNDLKYTGCVDAMELVPRPWAPQDAYNSTGDKLRTDGAIAVLRINDCAHPKTTPDDDALPPSRFQRVTRDTMLAVRNDLWRGNLAYQGVAGSLKVRSYLRTKDELKPDAGHWRKADVSGTDYKGARRSTVPFDQQPAARTDRERGGPPADTPPPEPSHRWDPPRYEIGLEGGYLRYPTLRQDGIGILAIPKGVDNAFLGIVLADEISGGWTAGISLTSNSWRWVSNEFSYQYQRGKYEIGAAVFGIAGEEVVEPDIVTQRVGLITRQFEYNVLLHLRRPESRWRPYIAAGPVLQLLSLADSPIKKPSGPFKLGAGNIGILKAAFDFGSTPPLEGGGIFQLGLQYGAGVKFRVHPRMTLRADFRETWSKDPEFIKDSYTKDFFSEEDFDVTFIPVGHDAKFRQQRFTLGVAFTF